MPGPTLILSTVTTPTLHGGCSACVYFLRPSIPASAFRWSVDDLFSEDLGHLTQAGLQLSYPYSLYFSSVCSHPTLGRTCIHSEASHRSYHTPGHLIYIGYLFGIIKQLGLLLLCLKPSHQLARFQGQNSVKALNSNLYFQTYAVYPQIKNLLASNLQSLSAIVMINITSCLEYYNGFLTHHVYSILLPLCSILHTHASIVL